MKTSLSFNLTKKKYTPFEILLRILVRNLRTHLGIYFRKVFYDQKSLFFLSICLLLNISIAKHIFPDKKEFFKFLGYNLKIFVIPQGVTDFLLEQVLLKIVVQQMFQLYIWSKSLKNICGGFHLCKNEKRKEKEISDQLIFSKNAILVRYRDSSSSF